MDIISESITRLMDFVQIWYSENLHKFTIKLNFDQKNEV